MYVISESVWRRSKQPTEKRVGQSGEEWERVSNHKMWKKRGRKKYSL